MIEIDLEKLADEIMRVEYPTYEQAIPGLREAIIRKKWQIKRVLERYIKQTTVAEAGGKEKEGSGGLPLHPLLMRGIASARREIS